MLKSELKINERQAGDVDILDLRGEIRAGEDCLTLRYSIEKHGARERNKILINLSEVRCIDSSGIGELIANHTTVRRGGGELKLLGLTNKITDLLVITKLLTVFDAYEREWEALNRFK